MNKVDLETSVNHHIALSAIMIKRVFFKILSENELTITPEQWNVLYHLSESGGFTVGELSKLTFKDFANISRITQKLEVAGLIKKRRDDADKRVFKLFITDSGMAIIEQLHQCAFESTNIALKGIDADNREVMLKGLKQILINTDTFLK
ncbi:MarR family transcriptional regulator [Carboxylicivirga sp. A043]|uniref:MarR family winged helix-turn-helix transcriptional regulator n=1 Tax=Carboxylicivirga litoralis TaxID=2816963 RepID=UPI0021CB5554|nr:MarR family transcriptional regulator [Carboxylicivirga sp. A043]MCU4155039.1 MarR family transcriptional regulator [Carboxylicivirga sp. A043]